MNPRFWLGLSILCAALLLAAPADAQTTSRCASCHFANLEHVPEAEFLGEWAQSPHARHGVGCERCHGGDGLTELPGEAHRGVLHPANPASSVHPANLAGTCAPCHHANAEAFEGSRHQALVDAGDRRAPTCATCHGVMRARTVSPAELQARCESCHPAGSPRAGYPEAMRTALETLDGLRARCDQFEAASVNIRDAQDRLTVRLATAAARYTLAEAVAAAHAFNADRVHERNASARMQLEAIADAIRSSVASRKSIKVRVASRKSEARESGTTESIATALFASNEFIATRD